jgi:hypothetical protein
MSVYKNKGTKAMHLVPCGKSATGRDGTMAENHRWDLAVTCSETCSTTAAKTSNGVGDCSPATEYQLFTGFGLFRNQQVSGSSPEGGSNVLRILVLYNAYIVWY